MKTPTYDHFELLISFGDDGHIGTLNINGMITQGMQALHNAPDGTIGRKVIWNTDLK